MKRSGFLKSLLGIAVAPTLLGSIEEKKNPVISEVENKSPTSYRAHVGDVVCNIRTNNIYRITSLFGKGEKDNYTIISVTIRPIIMESIGIMTLPYSDFIKIFRPLYSTLKNRQP